jgi:hypothetical protein
MRPTDLGRPAPGPVPDATEARQKTQPKQRLVRSDPLAAHPGSALALNSPQDRASYDVRTAIRRRIARREMLMRVATIAALAGTVLFAAYSYLL